MRFHIIKLVRIVLPSTLNSRPSSVTDDKRSKRHCASGVGLEDLAFTKRGRSEGGFGCGFASCDVGVVACGGLEEEGGTWACLD